MFKEKKNEKRQQLEEDICICCHKTFIPETFDQDMCRECLISYSDFLSPKNKKKII